VPIYVYRSAGEGCERCRDGLEVLQEMREAPLKACPHCGRHVEKAPAGFSAGKPSVLGSCHLKEHGFKKLRRTDKGGYVDDT
jgi:putative FmdB family regulatory protein